MGQFDDEVPVDAREDLMEGTSKLAAVGLPIHRPAPPPGMNPCGVGVFV